MNLSKWQESVVFATLNPKPYFVCGSFSGFKRVQFLGFGSVGLFRAYGGHRVCRVHRFSGLGCKA